MESRTVYDNAEANFNKINNSFPPRDNVSILRVERRGGGGMQGR